MFPQLGLPEMLVVMGVAVLLFGKRLPEVGRSLGRGIVEFKKGLSGIEDEFSTSLHAPPKRVEDEIASTPGSEAQVPKFEAPTQAPVAQEYAPQPYHD